MIMRLLRNGEVDTVRQCYGKSMFFVSIIFFYQIISTMVMSIISSVLTIPLMAISFIAVADASDFDGYPPYAYDETVCGNI